MLSYNRTQLLGSSNSIFTAQRITSKHGMCYSNSVRLSVTEMTKSINSFFTSCQPIILVFINYDNFADFCYQMS